MLRSELLRFARNVGFKRVYRNVIDGQEICGYEFSPSVTPAGNKNQIKFTAQFWSDGQHRLSQDVNDHGIDMPTYFDDIRSFMRAVDLQRRMADTHYVRCRGGSPAHRNKNEMF